MRLLIYLALVSRSTQQFTEDDFFIDDSRILLPADLLDGPTSISQAPTSTKTKHLSVTDIVYFNYFAASAYCNDQLQKLSCDTCKKFNSDVSYHKVLRNETTNTLAFIVVQPRRQEIVVTYRGSDNLANFIQDATFFQMNKGMNIKIHWGFLSVTYSLYSRVLSEVTTQLAANPGFKVVFVGHSLGGSMAAVTQFLFSYTKPCPGVTDLNLVTFGQPRTGNKGYVDYMNNLQIKMARVTYKRDIVPHLLPVSLVVSLFGEYFYHHQNEYWVDSSGNGRYCSSSTYEDPNCAASISPMYSVYEHVQYLGVRYSCINFLQILPLLHLF